MTQPGPNAMSSGDFLRAIQAGGTGVIQAGGTGAIPMGGTRAFQGFDVSDDGRISLEEFRHFAKAMAEG